MPVAGTHEPRADVTAKDVADAILFDGPREGALGKAIFLIGAGCSVSANVPGAVELARRMAREVAGRFGLCADGTDALDAYRALVRAERLTDAGAGRALADQTLEGVDWYGVYDEMFARYYRTPDHTRDLFGRVVADAKGAINWAHLCLGEIAARGLVSTVLTTNFDQLVLSGMVRAGLLPVICDGVESLNRIAGAPRHQQLVELHGSRHTYRLRNSPKEVEEVWEDSQASAAVLGLLQHATTFVAVGYGGREKGVMDLLIRAAQSYPDKNLFWVQRAADPAKLGAKARAFLSTSRHGGLLVDQDADVFFLDLCRHLGVGAPTAVCEPLRAVEQAIGAIRAGPETHPDIRTEIEAAKARIVLLREALGRAGRTVEDDIAAIRERRLAGHHAEAYRLAEKILERRDGLDAIDPKLLEAAASAALEHGRYDPDPEPLRRAVTWFRFLTRAEQMDPAAKPRILDQLGQALRRLGEREGGTERLEEAVTAYRAALEERTRERVPLDWAATQTNLGTALQILGEREGETTRLEEAVAAYRAALEERTRERVPLDWAATQTNLGTALQILGERADETTRLEEAVAAYRAALEERTRERVPLDWAMTQNNLGNALQALGARAGETTRLEEAVMVYRAALEEWTRERVPLDWAATQNNLGNVLQILGERAGETTRLEEAVAAYRAALEERARERVPLEWAGTQNNLGTALQALGERTGETTHLEEAVMVYRAALEEWTRERVPLDWAGTQTNLGTALQALGERAGETTRLEEAVAAYRAALEENTRERVPLNWAMSLGNQGAALIRLAERRQDVGSAVQALDQLTTALEVYEAAGHFNANFYRGEADRARAIVRRLGGDRSAPDTEA